MEDEEFSIATITEGPQFTPANEHSLIRRIQQSNRGEFNGSVETTPFYDPLGIFSSASMTPAPSFQPQHEPATNPITTTSKSMVDATNDSYFSRIQNQLNSVPNEDEDESLSNHSLSSCEECEEDEDQREQPRASNYQTSFRSDQASVISHHSLSDCGSDVEDEEETDLKQPMRAESKPTELKIIEDLRTELASIRDLNQHLIASQQETAQLLKSKTESLQQSATECKQFQVKYLVFVDS
jgi:hypothetical protein